MNVQLHQFVDESKNILRNKSSFNDCEEKKSL